jgi:tetratricopeptide (TPR) repeat protein
MPHVINGIGTWNYGKERVHCIKATCEFCHSMGELSSYDTTLYFVFVFIPILPLKKNRVLNECPRCRRFRSLSVKEWDRAKKTAMNETLAKLAEKPNDNEVLGAALLTACHFQDEQLFERIAVLAKSETEDPKLQHLLGETYGYFSRRAEADEAFNHALRNSPTPEIRRPAAMNAVRMGDLNRAAMLLSFVVQDRVADSLPHLQVVIDSMQSQGMHEEALALMDQRDEAFSECANDKSLQKARKQSSKYLGTGKKLQTYNLIDSQRSGTSAGSPRISRLLRFTLPILLTVAAAAFGGYSFWLGNNRPVYLVNGTSAPYRVQVHGTDHDLPPGQAVKVRVPEGDVTVESADYAPVTATLQDGFWSRPFAGSVAIFNPDRVAVIEEETATYSTNPQNVNPPSNFQIGKGYYSLKTPDYLFEPLPAQLKVKGSTTMTKTRIGISSGLTPIQYVALTLRTADQAEKVAILKSLCQAFPAELMFLQMAAFTLSPAELESFLKPGLALRPLRMEWHRMYQTHLERTRPDADLVPEYTRINDELKSGDSKYLLARILPDAEKSDAMMKEAAAASPPSAYAFFSLGNRAQAQADYKEGVKYANKACEAKPNNQMFEHARFEALWANRDYDACQELAARMASQGNIPYYERTLIRIGVAKNDPALIQSARTASNRPGVVQDPQFGLQLSIAEAVVRGNAKAYSRLMASLPTERNLGSELFLALLDNKLAAAERLCESDQVASCYALTSLALRKAGDAGKADAMAAKYIQYLASQGRDERDLAAMLEGKKPFVLKTALTSNIFPDEKRLVLLILAAKFPEHAAELRSLAAKLDVQRDEVSLVLKNLSK